MRPDNFKWHRILLHVIKRALDNLSQVTLQVRPRIDEGAYCTRRENSVEIIQEYGMPLLTF